MAKTYVFYHDNCNDGFGAALCAWKALGESNAKYIPIQYNTMEETIWRYNLHMSKQTKEIYFLDFCPSEKMIAHLACKHNVYTIDHHITAQSTIKNASERWKQTFRYKFDTKKSGTMLTWEYFFPRSIVPLFVKLLDDYDLYTFKYGNDTKTLFNALEMVPKEFVEWNRYMSIVELNRLLSRYASIQEYIKVKAAQVAENAFYGTISGYKAKFVFCPIYISEVGNLIANALDVDVAVVVSLNEFNKAKVSLRSVGNIDVSLIAKKFGGGGHKNAAGFYLNDLSVLWRESEDTERNKKPYKRNNRTKNKKGPALD